MTPAALTSLNRVELPSCVLALVGEHCIKGEYVAAEATGSAARLAALRTHAGKVVCVEATLEDGTVVVMARRIDAGLFGNAALQLKVGGFKAEGATLKLTGKVEWKRHPRLPADGLVGLRERVRETWMDALTLREQVSDENGNVVRPGLRRPQIGALHALAAHWTVDQKPALVVMPTGTGKTEVMLAGMIMQRPSRLLVLVPSDPLRRQTYDKFVSLGILPMASVLGRETLRPVAAVLTRGPQSAEDLEDLRLCNVVISTVAMLEPLPTDALKRLLDEFDAVFFDEAHHLPAKSWRRISELLANKRVVQFTATPFRRDGQRVQGRIIYNFPLRLAQEQGYFRKIRFIEVNEYNPDAADVEIAQRAVEQLRRDRAAGLNHILLARAETRERANRLFNEIYLARYADLQPAIIYTGLSGKKAKLEAIRAGQHQIVVCVDMFGEGFDLPALKIAAMHDLHGSLAITLQFTGRFTRSGTGIGDATLVANVADVRVATAIEDLYAEDADWNQLIPDLSSRAIQSQLDFAEFMEGMGPREGDGEGSFDLNILRPKTSVVIYRAPRFDHRKFRAGVKGETRVERHWFSRDRKMVVFVTRSRPLIDWATIKETTDEIWDLHIAAYDQQRELLFLHSSQKGSLHQDLARALGGPDTELISGERIFRVFHGVSRLVFHNVGLYGRGQKLRFRMFTGLDVIDAIPTATQAGSTKSNIFAAGYENGTKITIGASFKGRVWAMSSTTIPDWRAWCGAVADKLLNDGIRNNDFLQHTLAPKQIEALPDKGIFAVMLPDEWFGVRENNSRVTAGGVLVSLLSFEVCDWTKQSDREIIFNVRWDSADQGRFCLSWTRGRNELGVTQVGGPELELQHGGSTQRLDRFFAENPPVVLFNDGSEIKDGFLFERRETPGILFEANQIFAVDWGETDITVESKWRNGVQRADSVQGHFIEQRRPLASNFLIDDDDPGEAADVVEIVEGDSDVLIRLFHCKYSGADNPGARTDDLYVVCGQAIKSARLAERPQAMLRNLLRRDAELRRGRPTRFEKGTAAEFRGLLRRLPRKRVRVEIAIVQPGLSAARLTAELSQILGSADAFIREFTGKPLLVFGSA